ncbi:hypothetical protein KGM_203918 [Danaus plexippus plexippus]|uniref:Uncharacterized protein n=1 Tax=Danaus plexippus plexippus TaxID=278856 RepID=A0A212F9R1_DANPL|nr:hypothetical protein KGM_203918 [Danaus plexippus plexippus]
MNIKLLGYIICLLMLFACVVDACTFCKVGNKNEDDMPGKFVKIPIPKRKFIIRMLNTTSPY